MPNPYNSPLQFAGLALFVAAAVIVLDVLHRRSVNYLPFKPLPALWIMELSVVVVGVALVGAIAAAVCTFGGQLRVSTFLLSHVLPPLAMVSIPSVSLLFARELCTAPIVVLHASDHAMAGKRRYVYRLRKECSGVFSLHVRGAKFYDRHTSDVSIVNCTDAILAVVCQRLEAGDSLILATPNRRLTSRLSARVEKYFTHKNTQVTRNWTRTFPPIVGVLCNWWHEWGHPALSRVTMTGTKISL
ncbi:hypothetical protein NB700_001761 [Xanthomonas sacchari]|uniref:Uncharacterized protein n=1 Tax=Xanthomonas sacchari TaxID=56458 RepID=A0ABT3DW60_9XANT|nr:hypothetical protein [Xanthomonas sacchari]MCW0399205.1 hypothetical protein [Xanthomonas sacchari]